MSYDVIAMKSIAKELNDLTYTDYFYRLTLIARSVFKWSGLPNGIDEKWIERYLFGEGRCLFFKDKDLGFMIAKCNDSDMLNAYDEPTKLTPYATNYVGSEHENHVDCVVIRNNDLMLPTSPTIQLYAWRLAELTRTIDINVHAQQTPFAIACSEKQKLSVKRAYQQATGHEPVIYANKETEILDSLKVLKTDAPIVFDKLQIQKHAVWNECMTFLGINNANMDKRERLVDDEVQANNEQVEACANLMLKARQRACDEINKLFGLKISVKIRHQDQPKLEKVVDNND